MAVARGRLRGLREDRNLRRFVVEDVTPTGKTLGTGSYGTVEEIKVNGLVCAGKIIHEALVDADNVGVGNVANKYHLECQMMSDLRHPNVTQFLGVCFLPALSPLPVLMMEKLECSLDDLLESSSRDISLALKRSILEDVARGLLYLHKRNPPIIHRDLSAKNVLLTSSLSAKITDLGNSRIVNLQPGQLARTLSRVPGTLSYMPPEALDDTTRYGPSLDVFSFGHLGLFTALQVFPGTLRQPTYHDETNPERMLGRTEVERRGEYFDRLETKLPGGGQHPLVLLIKRCLHNRPSQRPTAEELLSALEEMKDGLCSDLEMLEASRHIVMMRSLGRVRGKDEEIRDLRQQLEQSQAFIQERDVELNQTRQEVVELQQQLQQTQAQLQQKNTRLNRFEREVQEKTVRLNEVQQQVERQNTTQEQLRVSLEGLRADMEAREIQLREKERELQQRDADISRLVRELRNCQTQLETAQDNVRAKDELLRQKESELATSLLQQQQSGEKTVQTPLSEPKLPLKLEWRRGSDMPFEMWGGPSAVVMKGDVYFGGGLSLSYINEQIVFVYSPRSDSWSQLPPYKYKSFRLTVINERNQLVAVGGLGVRTGKETNKLGVWDDKQRQWVFSLPAMNTACHTPAVATYNQWLLVAGGSGEQGDLSRVEMMNVSSKQWYQVGSLPVKGHQMSSTMIGNTWYLMGGYTDKGASKSVMNVCVEQIISDAISDAISQPAGANSSTASSRWNSLPDTPLELSTALAFQGALLAIGGWCVGPSSSIYLYQPSNSMWTKVGDMPTERSMPACTVLPKGHIMIAGGRRGRNRFDIAQVL